MNRNRCCTVYINRYHKGFTDYTEERARAKARKWLEDRNLPYEESEFWVEDTTDKYIDLEEVRRDDD